MGCQSSKREETEIIGGPAKPESDVDVASVREFDQEQKEAEAAAALRASREPSAASISHHSSHHSEAAESVQEDIKPPEPADDISLQSVQGEHVIPPLAPPRRNRDHLILHPSVFRETDRRVKHTPSSATSSVTSLAFYLTSACPRDLHDLHCARAIFYWLALNITYDSRSYLSGSVGCQEPGFVLQNRRAVCEGFARFCEVLCNLSNIPCLTIRGVAKGYSHDPETVYSDDAKANHAWNLVLVQGEWRPLDSAWGAGFLREDGTFRQELNDYWFLTDPAEFLSTHFPYMVREDSRNQLYQLCHRTIDISTFSSMVRRDQLACDVGLRLLTHKHGVIDDVIHDVVIRVQSTKRQLRVVTAYLTEKRGKGSKKDRSSVLTSRGNDDTWRIYVRPPRAATYHLILMGQVEEAEEEGRTTLHRLCVYALRCRKPHVDQAPFPPIRGSWGLQYPMATECGLRKVKDTTFQFKAKDGVTLVSVGLCRHTQVAVKLRHAKDMERELDQYTFVEYKNDGDVCVDVRLPRAGYFLLRVFASHPDLPGLQHVADFLLHTDSPAKDCLAFPLASDFAHVHRTRLIQPRVRELSRGVTWLFRVQALTLRRMRVNGFPTVRGVDGIWEAEVDFCEDDGKCVLISGSGEKRTTQLFGLYSFDLV